MKRQYSDAKEDPDEGGQSAPNMVSVKKADVPTYLHLSEFYLSLLADEGDDSILVPEECMKKNDTVDDKKELHSILLTLRFWVADSVCDAVLAYALTRPFESYEDILSEFYQDFPALKHIKSLTMSSDPMNVAIESGFISIVKYFLQLGHPWPDTACATAVEAGHTAMLKFAIESGCTMPSEASTIAAAKGYLACLKLLHEKGAIWTIATTAAAARGGHLDCLQYSHENGCPWLSNKKHPDDMDFEIELEDDDEEVPSGEMENGENNICTIAAGNGHLDCLQYAHNEGVPLQPRTVAAAAWRYNGLECLKYVHQQGLPLVGDLFDDCVQNDDIEMMKYLHEQGCQWNEHVFRVAAQEGSVECVKYMHENGCPWNEQVCEMAAKRHDLEMVLYLLSNGCPPSNNIWSFTDNDFLQVLQCFVQLGLPWSVTPQATKCAAVSDNIEGLNLLLKSGCPWWESTTFELVIENNYKMLQFVHDNGCPWHPYTSEFAALAGALECLQYAHTHGAPIAPPTCSVLLPRCISKAKRRYFECFKYAHEYGGCELPSCYTFYAARDGQLELLKYLHEQGCEWDPRAERAAEENNHQTCLEYITKHCTSGVT